MRFLKYVAAVVLVAAVGACGPLTSERLTEAKNMKPTGSAFHQALHKEYLWYGQWELDQGDLNSSDLNIDKAMMAAKGQTPALNNPRDRKIDGAPLNDLIAAQAKLLEAIGMGAMQKAPEKTAEAYAAYDCWVEQQEENIQPPHIAMCKKKFEDALAIAQAAVKPVEKPAAAPAPAPAAAKMPGPFTILFDLNKSNIRKDQQMVLQQAADAIKSSKPSVVNVTGHTDTTGSYAHNLKLSEKRASVIAQALKKMGVTSLVATYWVGEDDLAVKTGDNVKEEKNRRGVVVLGK